MAEQQQRRIEEAARQFSDALVESYRAVSEHTVSAQQLSAELTQDFFNGVINNLRAQGGGHPPDGSAAGRPAAAGY
jgi:hypothetical protein